MRCLWPAADNRCILRNDVGRRRFGTTASASGGRPLSGASDRACFQQRPLRYSVQSAAPGSPKSAGRRRAIWSLRPGNGADGRPVGLPYMSPSSSPPQTASPLPAYGSMQPNPQMVYGYRPPASPGYGTPQGVITFCGVCGTPLYSKPPPLPALPDATRLGHQSQRSDGGYLCARRLCRASRTAGFCQRSAGCGSPVGKRAEGLELGSRLIDHLLGGGAPRLVGRRIVSRLQSVLDRAGHNHRDGRQIDSARCGCSQAGGNGCARPAFLDRESGISRHTRQYDGLAQRPFHTPAQMQQAQRIWAGWAIGLFILSVLLLGTLIVIGFKTSV